MRKRSKRIRFFAALDGFVFVTSANTYRHARDCAENRAKFAGYCHIFAITGSYDIMLVETLAFGGYPQLPLFSKIIPLNTPSRGNNAIAQRATEPNNAPQRQQSLFDS